MPAKETFAAADTVPLSLADDGHLYMPRQTRAETEDEARREMRYFSVVSEHYAPHEHALTEEEMAGRIVPALVSRARTAYEGTYHPNVLRRLRANRPYDPSLRQLLLALEVAKSEPRPDFDVAFALLHRLEGLILKNPNYTFTGYRSAGAAAVAQCIAAPAPGEG